MSLADTLARWRARLTGETGPVGPSTATQPTESDAGHDPRTAASRPTGGAHTEHRGDRGSVTGTGDTDVFVGRAAGQDPGYAGETGAEARREAEQRDER
ncbi:hypothetical protein EV188_110167 [Actinomycetospora succinea]|uniref:Uncharacterized protein n=1 Tax=Actinomycetospora succinea TaxID=663603 RepID=A0A4R6USH1_9PSEU|nr:hypothetical protein [Actinomycetospora succinea]TDQ50170.1 hypothetical protein EV188_110167 [Actinomycetospora succinea]